MTQLLHLQLVGGMTGDAYSPPQHRRRGRVFTPPQRNVPTHASALRTQFQQSINLGQTELNEKNESELTRGLTFTLESAAGFDLKLDSLDNRTRRIRLLHVYENNDVQSAVIFVPHKAMGHFLSLLEAYERPVAEGDSVSNWRLINSIERVRLTIAKDLWESIDQFPTGDALRWWEVWFWRSDENSAEEKQRITQICEEHGLEVQPGWLEFSERYVALVKARPDDWGRSRVLLELVAELRRPPEPNTPYLGLSPAEQGEWVTDLRRRLSVALPSAPAVCLLDTGVHRGHPLLEDSLLANDWLAVDPAWGSADNADADQHGTLMAGTSLFGNLSEHFDSHSAVQLNHRLESVRLFPRAGSNHPDNYGWITSQAISVAEIENPNRQRVCCLAITAPNTTTRWLPTSWSSAVDQLSYNDGDSTRLIVVSSGNIRVWNSADYTYPDTHWTEKAAIEDPAHATNALVVGAFTNHPRYDDADCVGVAGGLSPTSRTSVIWDSVDRTSWPLKPDVVFEGGNLRIDDRGMVSRHSDSELLTTAMYNDGALLDSFGATSAATAQASRLAAEILARYPRLRPETVRALIVHSANWTPIMEEQVRARTKTEMLRRIRAFGYGIPNRDRSLASVANDVTLVSEEAIYPYEKRGGSIKLKQMGVHSLPWPKDALLALGNTPVTMRTTLSYFIEPNPGQGGRIPLTTYSSHDLRFDLQRKGESIAEFKARVSDLAQAEGEDSDDSTACPAYGWTIGPNQRTRGSIHSDWWKGTAEDLASCESLIVYPVGGWWKTRPFLRRFDNVARYSLIVSVETPPESIDLYTLLTTQTEVPVDIVAAH